MSSSKPLRVFCAMEDHEFAEFSMLADELNHPVGEFDPKDVQAVLEQSKPIEDLNLDVVVRMAAAMAIPVIGNEGPLSEGRWRWEYYRDLARTNPRNFRFGSAGITAPDVDLVITGTTDYGAHATINFGRLRNLVVVLGLQSDAAAYLTNGTLPQFRLNNATNPMLADLVAPRGMDNRASPNVYLQLVASPPSLFKRPEKLYGVQYDGAKIDSAYATTRLRSGMDITIFSMFRHLYDTVPLPAGHHWRQTYTTRKLPRWDGQPPKVSFQIVSDDGDHLLRLLGKGLVSTCDSADGYPMYVIDFARLYGAEPESTKQSLCNLLNRVLAAGRYNDAGEQREFRHAA
jgi:hypothetical protein